MAEDFLEKAGDTMDKDDKRRLDYRPDIQYQEDYYSDYDGDLFSDFTDLSNDNDNNDDLYDQNYMDHIQDTINDLVQLIPNLTPELQTAVNQVFKPIFNDWYKNLKKKKYPTTIPDPDTPIIIPDNPWDPGPGPMPGPELWPPEDDGDDPIIGKPPLYKKPEPDIYIPKIDPPIIPEIPENEPGDIFIGETDNIFDPATPWGISYAQLDPIEIIELEYVKNLAELYNYYTDRLKKTIGKYYLTLFQASITSGRVKGTSNELRNYFIDKISESDAKANEDANLKHLADAVVRNEITGRNKLNFYTNMFSLESTLYHMKNFKAAYELRLRYEKEEMLDVKTSEDSMSNRMLTGSRENYNKKYDNAYINLYKYLNSSISVLIDVINTQALSIKAKETLYKKGGTTK